MTYHTVAIEQGAPFRQDVCFLAFAPVDHLPPPTYVIWVRHDAIKSLLAHRFETAYLVKLSALHSASFSAANERVAHTAR